MWLLYTSICIYIYNRYTYEDHLYGTYLEIVFGKKIQSEISFSINILGTYMFFFWNRHISVNILKVYLCLYNIVKYIINNINVIFCHNVQILKGGNWIQKLKYRGRRRIFWLVYIYINIHVYMGNSFVNSPIYTHIVGRYTFSMKTRTEPDAFRIKGFYFVFFEEERSTPTPYLPIYLFKHAT